MPGVSDVLTKVICRIQANLIYVELDFPTALSSGAPAQKVHFCKMALQKNKTTQPKMSLKAKNKAQKSPPRSPA
jgi:hypothetical protein